jgi:hypothetical protein
MSVHGPRRPTRCSAAISSPRTMPDIPRTGFEAKSDLFKVMRELAQ